jgi:hypothetical protein
MVILLAFVLVLIIGLSHRATTTVTAPSTPKTSKTTTRPAPTAPATTIPLPTHATAAFMPHDLPLALSRSSAVIDGSTVLVLGGLTSSGSTAKVYRFDPATAAVTQDGQLASAVHDAAAASIGGKAVIFGGGDETHTVATVQVYGPPAGQSTGQLPSARSDLVATRASTHVYVLGGFDGTNLAADVLQTDNGATFRSVARLPVPVRYPAVAAMGNIIYLFGGQTSSQAGNQTAAVQAIDVAAGTARVIANLPQAMSEATAWVQQGAFIIAGGRQGAAAGSAIVRFDPATGQTTALGSLPRPTADAPVAVINDVAYLFGGEGTSRLTGIVKITLA